MAGILAKQEFNPIIQNMLKRAIKPLLLKRLAEYPAVALLGSRQCGKTTLARSLGGHRCYFDVDARLFHDTMSFATVGIPAAS